MTKKIEIEFTEPFMHYGKGQRVRTYPKIAKAWIDAEIAKRVEKPKRNKMVSTAPRDKST